MALQACSIWNMQTFLGGTYHIPDYQREYSWEDNELSDFWDDLESTRNDPDQLVHFFGQIVVHNDDEKAKYIIDGQQRTITSVIFLRALQLCYKQIYDETGNPDAEEQYSDISGKFIGRLTVRKGNSLHLILNVLDCDYFREHIQLGTPDPRTKEKKKSHDRMRKAFLFFAEKLNIALAGCGDNVEDHLECLDAYFDAFALRFNVLYMEATKLEEAFVIFETLNARGKDLETADLLKNYIFSQSKDVSLAQKQWNNMVATLDKADPTKFIRHFWNSCHEFTRDKALYRTISKEISSPKASKDLLATLVKLAPTYHSIAFPNEDSIFQNATLLSSLNALRVLKARSFYPVILAMQQSDPSFSESEIALVASAIETYVFRNQTIYGKVANTSERFFASLAKQIYEGVFDNCDEICNRIHSELIPDDAFQTAFALWTPARSEKEIIRYVLTRIHKHIDRTMELNLDASEVHIEHIMPVDASKWSISSEVHDSYLWRLGNLMLLSGPINISISNRPFDEKKGEYLNSKIEPNKAVGQLDTWDEKTIKARQEDLSTYALQIWKV